MRVGHGFLKIQLYTGDYTLRGDNVTVLLKRDGEVLHSLLTDENGTSELISLEAPSLENEDGLDMDREYFGTVDVEVPAAQGFKGTKVYGVQIFDGLSSILNVRREIIAPGDSAEDINIHVPREHGVNIDRDNSAPENHVHGQGPVPADEVSAAFEASDEKPEDLITPLNIPLAKEVVIPDFINVHLGTPNAAARNVRVPFKEYIINVVSSEVYPFWDKAAIEANTHAIISFTLNRLFTDIRR